MIQPKLILQDNYSRRVKSQMAPKITALYYQCKQISTCLSTWSSKHLKLGLSSTTTIQRSEQKLYPENFSCPIRSNHF